MRTVLAAVLILLYTAIAIAVVVLAPFVLKKAATFFAPLPTPLDVVGEVLYLFLVTVSFALCLLVAVATLYEVIRGLWR